MSKEQTLGRANFVIGPEGVEVCWGNHEKSSGCRWEALSPAEIVGIIEFLRRPPERSRHPHLNSSVAEQRMETEVKP